MKKAVLVVMFLAMIGSFAPAYAVNNMDYSRDNPPGYQNLFNRIVRKLGRGISNAAFGALELPIQICITNFEEGGIAAVTFGVLKGTGYFILREVVGVVEIVTFPVPLPGCPNDPYDVGAGYGPILEPEWIITPNLNYGNVVFQSSQQDL